MEPFNFAAFADDKTAWSIATFGPGKRTAGVIDHIRKELAEVEARPDDVSEWADLIILAMDGAARSAGADGAKLVEALVAKMARNKARTWPDWRTLSEDRAIEHDRSGEPSVPDLLARIDADAIVARIDNAIACTIRPSELEAVRAIVCDAVTAGQDAGIDHAIDRQDEESEASDADRIHAAAVKIAALAEKAAAMNQNRMAQIKEAAAAIAAYADDIRPECPE